jgi:hypothetical protein
MVRNCTRQPKRSGTATMAVGTGCWYQSTSDSATAVRRHGAAANEPISHALPVSIFNAGNLAQT